MLRHTINVAVLHDANASVASVDFTFFDMDTGEITTCHATGSAKREPGDRNSDTIATALSVGRALVNLGHELETEGLELVADAVQEEAVARAERMLRTIQPVGTTDLLPLQTLIDRYGLEAAKRAAVRRGMEADLAVIIQGSGRHEKPA